MVVVVDVKPRASDGATALGMVEDDQRKRARGSALHLTRLADPRIRLS